MDKQTENPQQHPRRAGRGWILVVAIAISLVAAYLIHGVLTGGSESLPPAETAAEHAEHAEHGATEQAQVWTCSMHPQVQLPKPGVCPICNMQLIPRATGE